MKKIKETIIEGLANKSNLELFKKGLMADFEKNLMKPELINVGNKNLGSAEYRLFSYPNNDGVLKVSLMRSKELLQLPNSAYGGPNLNELGVVYAIPEGFLGSYLSSEFVGVIHSANLSNIPYVFRYRIFTERL
jgi:hypothetical protein